MALEFAAQALHEDLLPSLKNTFEQQAGELRLDLPNEWSLFWKAREGDTRILVAHPSKDQWVGTIALEPQFASRLIERLEKSVSGDEIRFSSVDTVSKQSNLDLVFKLR
jgi:hypothetical protein